MIQLCALPLMAYSSNKVIHLFNKLLTSSYNPCTLLATGYTGNKRNYSSSHGIFIAPTLTVYNKHGN